MWQRGAMGIEGLVAIHRSMVDGLIVDSMMLADEIESYFGGDELEASLPGMGETSQAAIGRVGLRLASRINRVVEWLVRADVCAERPPEAVGTADQLWNPDDAALLPPRARALAEATRELFVRIERMSEFTRTPIPVDSPARALQARLAASLGIVAE